MLCSTVKPPVPIPGVWKNTMVVHAGGWQRSRVMPYLRALSRDLPVSCRYFSCDARCVVNVSNGRP